MLRKQLLELVEKNDLVAEFLDKYFDLVRDIKFIEEGHENATYSFQTSEDIYILRISKPEKDKDRIAEEIKFMNYLRSRGCPVPKIIPNRNNNFISIVDVAENTICAMVMEKLLGKSPQNYTEDLVAEIGQWMGNMHKFSADFTASKQRKVESETEYFTKNKLRVGEVKDPAIRTFLREAAEFSWDISRLPQGIIHGDFHKNNLLTVNNKLTAILDFDDI